MKKCPVCNNTAKYIFNVKTDRVYKILKCQYCELGFIDPIPTKKEVSKFYNEFYFNNAKHMWGYNNYKLLELGLKKTYRRILKKIKIKNVNAILDVGCAYGFFLDVIKEFFPNSHRIGIDIINTKSILEQKEHEFICADIEDINFKETFDIIFFGDSFEHLRSPVKVIEKLSNNLSNDGCFIITTVNFSSLLAKIMKQKWRLMIPPEHIFFWTPKSLKEIFKRVNLNAKVEKYILFYPKTYVIQKFKEQFRFTPFFLNLLPFDILPIPSIDVIMCVARRGQ